MVRDDLIVRQQFPLEMKEALSIHRIRTFLSIVKTNGYVSFSGGKDSTVLLHLARRVQPDIPAVFCNTGLEYPEIVEFVNGQENVTIIRPKKSFRTVIKEYGYPVISKEQAQFIDEYRSTQSELLKNSRLNGNKKGTGKISAKWRYLINAPFKISNKCCDWLKKKPFAIYQKQSGRYPIIGIMAEESQLRKQKYNDHGCIIADESKNKFSCSPLLFWMEKDIWEYIRKYDVPYCNIYNNGVKRTGCIFCVFGAHIEQRNDELNRFEKLKLSHPELWRYCMDKLELRTVLNYCRIRTGDNIQAEFTGG